jgi:hypothetical protein
VLRERTWLEKQSGLTYASDYAAGKQLLAVRRHLKGFAKQFGEILGSFVPGFGAVPKNKCTFVFFDLELVQAKSGSRSKKKKRERNRQKKAPRGKRGAERKNKIDTIIVATTMSKNKSKDF